MRWLQSNERTKDIHSIPDASMLGFLYTLLVCVSALEASLLSWLLPIIALLMLWKVLQLFTDIRPARAWLVNTIAVTITLVIAVQVKQSTILSSLINLLLLSCSLSLLMTKRKIQATRVAMTCYFCIASSFVFVQGLLWSVVLGSAALACTWAVFNCYRETRIHTNTLLKSRFITLIWQAGIIAILCFAFMPRIPPFWKLPNLQGSKTGLSDTVDPGSIAELVKSDELVFRASFDGNTPNQEALYWRAIVHDTFDGQRWLQNPTQKGHKAFTSVNKNFQQVIRWRKEERNANRSQKASLKALTTDTVNFNNVTKITQYSYRILAEPSDKPWLFTLDAPVQHSENVRYTTDRRIQRTRQTTGTIDYTVSSITELPALLAFEPAELLHNLSLPPNSNPQTAQLVQRLRGRSLSDKQYVTLVLQWFTEQNLQYTLRPPPVAGPNPIDQILFNNKQGFCAHFASSFSVMMRMAGIPARVVTGYFGGEYSSNGEFLSVYQYDAHAWSEVWLPDSGWTPFDPTAFVAPQRINEGLEDAVSDPDSFLADSIFSLNRYRNVQWINWLRMQGAYADYYWTSWIVRYNHKQQDKLLSSFTNNHNVILAMFAGLASVIIAVLLVRWWRLQQQQHTPEAQQQLLQSRLIALNKHFAQEFSTSTPPLTLIDALETPLSPTEKTQLAELRQAYITHVLKQNTPTVAALKQMNQAMEILLKSHSIATKAM